MARETPSRNQGNALRQIRNRLLERHSFQQEKRPNQNNASYANNRQVSSNCQLPTLRWLCHQTQHPLNSWQLKKTPNTPKTSKKKKASTVQEVASITRTLGSDIPG